MASIPPTSPDTASKELIGKEIWAASLEDLPHDQFRALSKLVDEVAERVKSSTATTGQQIDILAQAIDLGSLQKVFVKVSISDQPTTFQPAMTRQYCFLVGFRPNASCAFHDNITYRLLS